MDINALAASGLMTPEKKARLIEISSTIAALERERETITRNDGTCPIGRHDLVEITASMRHRAAPKAFTAVVDHARVGVDGSLRAKATRILPTGAPSMRSEDFTTFRPDCPWRLIESALGRWVVRPVGSIKGRAYVVCTRNPDGNAWIVSKAKPTFTTRDEEVRKVGEYTATTGWARETYSQDDATRLCGELNDAGLRP